MAACMQGVAPGEVSARPGSELAYGAFSSQDALSAPYQ